LEDFYHLDLWCNIVLVSPILSVPSKPLGTELAAIPGDWQAHNISPTTMKLRQRPSSFLLLLVPCLHFTSALFSSEEVIALAEGKQIGPPPVLPISPDSKPTLDGLGTKDAPVDGKDGRPHLGPFVETSAERDRKKAKGSGDDEKIKKPVPSSISGGGASSDDGWKMPETNDGVMDDPNRSGPKEGTRGTEGGISEKSKDKKEGLLEGTKAEKKPDPPKEVPPLPHSEQEKLDQKATKDDAEKSKDANSKDDGKQKDKQKEVGGLEVTIIRGYVYSKKR